jgi:hypothetical protein
VLQSWLPGLVGVLLTAGGAAFLTTMVRGWSTIRSGAHAREREAIDDLGRYRDDLDRRLRLAERDRDFWRYVAGRYAGQLARAGMDPAPAEPVPPSERTPEGTV